MFERYTDKARRVIFFARYEASQFGAPAIEPEHLLLGLLREDKNVLRDLIPYSALTEIGAEVKTRSTFKEKISASVELPLSAATKRVLAYAHQESDCLHHRHIGTEHLLLGLLRDEQSIAWTILNERGVNLEAARQTTHSDIKIPSEEESGAVLTARTSVENANWIDEIRDYGRGLLNLSSRLKQQFMNNTLSVEEESGRRPAEDKKLSGAVRSGRRTQLGVERLLTERVGSLRGARVGVVCNQASVDHEFRHAADLFKEHSEINLTALFGPQHGIRGDVQDNMVETPHDFDRETKVPVYSLYSETREPTEEMLKNVDVLVFDMLDVGCRIYTFIYTLANCMRAAVKYGKKVVVCDRPNPIGGERVAGTVLEVGQESFVGQFPLPTRHGMTIGELAGMFRDEYGLNPELEIVTMKGWSREQYFDETDAPWVMPSPNMPTLDSAIVFPGTVHAEGTGMSEGRGTTRPFELFGAPYVEAAEYTRRLERFGLAGVRFRAANFLPTFQKHAGRTCGGAQMHILDRHQFEPVIAGIATIKLAYDMYGEGFRWKEPPYEYVFDRNPFDVIAGTTKLREAIERGDSLETIEASWQRDLERFEELRRKYLLY
ncbi:MAG: DUF1343 domain-containing protein [Pyrinomonadaceae bacterium]|nr:DUF1343 domain-containing protein [Pyrinomonadaceae bacterium]